uniref:Uncharacterized protein n=1 Tax=Siphoviridae sp. ctwfx1 TaxID=2825732 RepID=A0A8S5UVG2_9CAUD|nr:MAG TPA: hypothetical protein [Siphoviridae sp. ctwfx1]
MFFIKHSFFTFCTKRSLSTTAAYAAFFASVGRLNVFH